SAGLIVPQNPEEFIRVRLYDYAGVSPATLAGAKAAASYVLEHGGVRLEWAECRIHQDDPPKDQACKLPVTRMDLQLRIMDAAMARRTGTTRHCLGYALLADGFHSIAAVYLHRAVELEKRNLADRAAILGAMMTHEIGHLLLEQSGHSGSGIMRARWGNEDLKVIAKGRMWFTADEASRLTSMVARRQQASAKNNRSPQ
ncbi:MAG: hypothetical protein HY238_13240, partial [Acidobacteria bacterium]|nr:hypothetical protein [Acidobacteriota bacterium]